jgi:DNA helicase IV
MKGLEVARVILVAIGDLDRESDERTRLLYAGASRAIDSLAIVADSQFRKALSC